MVFHGGPGRAPVSIEWMGQRQMATGESPGGQTPPADPRGRRSRTGGAPPATSLETTSPIEA